MTSDRIFNRNCTYTPDNFTQEIMQEDLIHRFSNNMAVDMASTGWMKYIPGEEISDPKIDRKDNKINARAYSVNRNNKFIKRYCF